MSERRDLDPALSVYLDALRGLAALVVFVAHAMLQKFHGGDAFVLPGFNFGLDAVVVFFVISGFVVAHAAQGRTLEHFVFARASRLWSVAVPAVIFTFVLDRIGVAANPAAYDGPHYNSLSFAQYLFYGLTFANEWSLAGERVGVNNPLWSLSYEAAYYVLFAIAFYTTGLRRIALLGAGVVLFGLNVLLLLPAWLAGVGAYYLIQAKLPGARWLWYAAATLPLLLYVWVILVGHPTLEREPFGDFGRSDYFVWHNITALLVALHIVAVAKLWVGRQVAPAPVVRYLAGASFSIYVMHFPLMHFGWAALGMSGLPFTLIVCPVTLALCFLFARIFEQPLPVFRKKLRAIFRTICRIFRSAAPAA